MRTNRIDVPDRADLYIDIKMTDELREELNKLYNKEKYSLRQERKHVTSDDISAITH
jgi:hypothetical protein